MKALATGIGIAILVLSGCVLGPDRIEDKIDGCEEHDLVPVIILRRDGVRRVNCIPDESYIIIEREVQLIKLPTLPQRP